MSRSVFLALGSNLGNREANILEAVRLLDEKFGVDHTALSAFFYSEAAGFDGPDFVNAAVRYELEIPALDILAVCKDIEKAIGRTREGIELDSNGQRIYHSRVMDIDVLLVGEECIDSPKLTIPHPRMKERDFVMVPLTEIL